MNRHFFTATFALGAMALVWVAAGFFGTHLLALLVTLLIAAVYGFGALELHRFRQDSTRLQAALSAIPEGLSDLSLWLASLPATLQNPVRLRIEGERVGLPGPALTPYLVGLLVMLGMLGTFLGMVVTLNGAVFALEGTSDLAAIRAAFATPIKGLGLAFGTSVAGVASSAMLGLMSALSRRERMQTAQLLDSKIASQLRSFSHSHQRQETFKALQLQSQALPQIVDKMQAMMLQMDRMGQQMHERLLSNQESFHSSVTGVYTELARSVDQSLRDSLSQGAQIAGDSLKPVVEAAMTGIAGEARLMHERMLSGTQAQVEALSSRLQASAATVAASWTAALSNHEAANASMVAGVGQSLQAFNASFEQRAQALLLSVKDAYAGLQTEHAHNDTQRLQAWRVSLESMAAGLQTEWQHSSAQTLAQQQAICSTLTETAQQMADATESSAGKTLADVTQLLSSSEALVAARIASEAEWTATHGTRMEQIASVLQSELAALRSAEATRGQAAVDRFAELQATLYAHLAALRTDEAQRGDAAVNRLSELQAALTVHLTTLGTALEDPITRLIQTASEAPRAAAEVIGQLRQEISHSVARDNALLEERSRIMETLNTLLEGINHASMEQRAVIDALVGSSALSLTQAGEQFAARVDGEAAKLADIAAHVTSSSVEVASLGETFHFAVRSFNEANEKLIANLQRIEAAMDKSMARSDDQLAYYVAQAREVIDLSIMSQKEIVEELRQLGNKQAVPAQEAA